MSTVTYRVVLRCDCPFNVHLDAALSEEERKRELVRIAKSRCHTCQAPDIDAWRHSALGRPQRKAVA